MYAYFDSTASQPTPVLGWIEGDTPFFQTLSPDDVIELTQEQWNSREATPFVMDGKLVPEPVKTADQLLALANAQLKSSAKGELDATDLVAFRCFKAGVTYPAEWQAYTLALRNIVNGVDTQSTSLPSKPAYPSGT
jgi:hypothetical protein